MFILFFKVATMLMYSKSVSVVLQQKWYTQKKNLMTKVVYNGIQKWYSNVIITVL